MAVIGIDNGATGTIGFICKSEYKFYETPSFLTHDYQTSKNKRFSRLSFKGYMELLKEFKQKAKENNETIIAYIERPLVNPLMFSSSLGAVRCHEAELIGLELLEISYLFIDSKSWQRELLPSGLSSKKKEEGKKKATNELKKASLDLAIRLFPLCKETIEKHKDGDGLLIARYGKIKEGE